ncbi:MAG TPA: DUF6112 family protein [Acidimicrobiales bacterium]|nr:DUF6112 family protein [Acidimicrobiales bacterium]
MERHRTVLRPVVQGRDFRRTKGPMEVAVGVLVLADVTLNPSVNALPGGGTLQTLINGLGAWALIAALAGLVIGAAAWALGVHAQNFQQSMVGRRAVLVSGLAALLIGAAPTIVNFFFNAGTSLH